MDVNPTIDLIKKLAAEATDDITLATIYDNLAQTLNAPDFDLSRYSPSSFASVFESFASDQSLFPSSAPSQQVSEKDRIQQRLDGFKPKETEAWKALSNIYGTDITQKNLLDFAEYSASQIGLCIDRDAKRRKNVLLKWLDDNWSKVAPYLETFVPKLSD